MIFGINATRDISKLSQITYNNFEISLVVFIPNISTNHAITYTNDFPQQQRRRRQQEREKSNRVIRLSKQNFAGASRCSVNFFTIVAFDK